MRLGIPFFFWELLLLLLLLLRLVSSSDGDGIVDGCGFSVEGMEMDVGVVTVLAFAGTEAAMPESSTTKCIRLPAILMVALGNDL